MINGVAKLKEPSVDSCCTTATSFTTHNVLQGDNHLKPHWQGSGEAGLTLSRGRESPPVLPIASGNGYLATSILSRMLTYDYRRISMLRPSARPAFPPTKGEIGAYYATQKGGIEITYILRFYKDSIRF